MSVREVVEIYIPEGSTWLYQGVLRDETGAAIAAASLTTLTLTIYATGPGKPLVNAVDGTNILNTGRGAVDANGNLSITFLPADQALVIWNGANPEEHIAEVEWTWSAGAKAGKHEILFRVWDLAKA